MCDSLCALTSEGTIFAKNSDRPADELQLPAVHGARPGGGRLRTQYLEMDDAGAAAVLLSRPDWLWGAEHGLSEHGVAVGNERVDTAGGADRSPAALIGMDLVRLGLERARSAEGAVDAIVALLERHGQGGLCDRTFDQAYDSSFLVADGTSAWVLETAGRDWAAQPVPAKGVAAISNRLTIRRDWTRASAAVKAGGDFDAWRDPGVDSAYADGRLAASRDFLGCGDGPSGVPHQPMTARRMVSHLRDHGTEPWGEPGRPLLPGRNGVAPPPPAIRATGRDISVCMHVGGIMATTASMVAWLPDATGRPIRSWLALGSPCVSL
ncbi:MAG TPA: C69 family dipeptidase, partial [Acidimicrobiales bacterium]|nr:C69 family dipeptidase [Acidimicrobiales bacterium]